MKKKLGAIFAVFTALCCFGGCDFGSFGGLGSGSSDSGFVDSGASDSGSGGIVEDGSDFTPAEKKLFQEYFGWVIPFVPNRTYSVEEYSEYYSDDDVTEFGLQYYVDDLTQTEFNTFKAAFSSANGYTAEGTEKDDDGDTWYYFDRDEFYIDFVYYKDGANTYLDVYVYGYEDGNTSSGSGSGGSSADLITAEGKGLPTGKNGVYTVDFTKATYAKDVTELGYYLDGCPTVGSPKVLVIPVEFSDCTAQSKGYQISAIKNAFEKGGVNDYYSVSDYYYQSSYGKLDLQFTVADVWFRPAHPYSYYKNKKIDVDGTEIDGGDQLILDEALAYLSKLMDLSVFDTDNNSVIDAVVMVNTLDIDAEITMQWAYRYWNMYTDNNNEYYEYDGVSANDYLWASYQFLLESYDASGNVTYADKSVRNTYTFIHEFGHVLGADDYYDTSYSGNKPLEDCDVMDGMTGDHNAYTKFNYGWITSSRLVVGDSVTLTLEDFSKNGDTIILANNWDEALGAYQEYYVLAYYRNVGLNADKNGQEYGYFSRDGVVVYHVNACLFAETYDGEAYYYIYNTNTDPSDEDYGTENNLIEFVKSAAGHFTYTKGDKMPSGLKDDFGNALQYNFVVDSLTNDAATITFTKTK